MRSMFFKNLSSSGMPFINERTSETSNGILVLNQGQPHIDFANDVDIKSTDWIVNSVGERLYITNIVPISIYKSCYFISEYEYQKSNQKIATFTINADKIENSIIGNQSTATINLNSQLQKMKNDIENSSSADKDELLQMIHLLEEIKDNQEPVPKGFLSKFSATMERNSWISSPVAGFLLTLFLH